MVESAVSQVGEGAGNPFTDGGSSAEMPHRGKITATMRSINFEEERIPKKCVQKCSRLLRISTQV